MPKLFQNLPFQMLFPHTKIPRISALNTLTHNIYSTHNPLDNRTTV